MSAAYAAADDTPRERERREEERLKQCAKGARALGLKNNDQIVATFVGINNPQAGYDFFTNEEYELAIGVCKEYKSCQMVGASADVKKRKVVGKRLVAVVTGMQMGCEAVKNENRRLIGVALQTADISFPTVLTEGITTVQQLRTGSKEKWVVDPTSRQVLGKMTLSFVPGK